MKNKSKFIWNLWSIILYQMSTHYSMSKQCKRKEYILRLSNSLFFLQNQRSLLHFGEENIHISLEGVLPNPTVGHRPACCA